MTSYSPVRRVCDDLFGEANGHDISLGVWYPNGGYVDDPQLAARNLAEAAIRHGADFRWKSPVTSIIKDAVGASVQGVVLKDGSVVNSGIVVNAAGPHSSAMHKLAFDGSAVGDDSNIHSQPLRVEVAYVC
jgi:glycine/D-amino acid oxidase-like deaminating enzyme